MYFSMNQTPADETTIANQMRSFLYFVKTKLVANGWTVKSSSTGASYSGSTDLWAAYTDVSSNNTLSWSCLESPASIITGGTGKVWIVLGYNSGGTAYNAYMTAHRELPTGGAANTMPTTATVLTVLNNGALIATPLSSAKFHIAIWPTGAFWAGASLSGANISTCLQVMPVTDIIGSFPYAIAFNATYAAASWPQTHFNNMKSWNSDGSVTSNGAFCTAEARLQSSFTLLGATITTAGNLAGNQEASKIYINISGQGKIGTLGGSTYDFLACGSTALANGTTDAATPKHTFNNNIFWPSNAAII